VAIGQKLRSNVAAVFRCLQEAGDDNSEAAITNGQLNLTLKQKAKILALAVKKYPSYNLRRALWKWHLNTQSGHAHIQRAVDQLVLYTNINLDTAAYRLFRLVKSNVPARRVTMRDKRLGLVLFFLTRSAAMRRIRECFGEVHGFVRKGRLDVARRLLESAALRKKHAFNWWRDANNRNIRARAVKEHHLRKMLDNRVGRVFSALLLVRALPPRREPVH